MINSGKKLEPRGLTKIIGGILTSTNTFTHKNNDTIEKHLTAQLGLKGIDIGCIADYGFFYIDYNGNENEAEADFNKRITDYYNSRTINKISFSDVDNSLVSFFLQLTRYLQQAIGTIPAIDLNAYSKTINFEIDEEL